MQITLTVTDGPHTGKRFSFSGHDTFLVGRSPRTHFRLSDDDRFFSRIHFLVEANPPHCRLLDMNSRNGTYVNGERVESRDLRDGDLIKAGRTIIHVTFEESNSSAYLPALVSPPNPAVRAVPVAAVPAHPIVTPVAAPVPPVAPPVARCVVCGAPPVKASEDALALCRDCRENSRRHEQRVPGYRIVREIGSGAMGQVSLAVRISDSLPVALKTVTPAVAGRPSQLDRFLREAEILSQIRHPNVVAFHDMGKSESLLWFAMDYIRGVDGFKLLRKEGPLPVGRAVTLICQLLDALNHAHDHKFVHRDIKPSNLLVENPGEGERLKLADFGLARVYQSSQLSGLTLNGEVGGTVGFMAPEQITDFRDAEPAADLYSAAASLYNLLTGAYIFQLTGDLRQRLLAVLQDDPIPIQQRRPELPASLAKVIHCGLEREPHKRWPSAAAFRSALLPFAGAR